MLLSDLIEQLQEIQKEHGDLQVSTGLSRSGYGELVDDVQVMTVNKFGADGSALEKVVELVLSDETTFEVDPDTDGAGYGYGDGLGTGPGYEIQ